MRALLWELVPVIFDPAIVEFIAKKENLDIAGVMNVLNKKSGLQGMSGVGSDMRDIRAAIADGNEDAKNAYDVLCYWYR